MTEVLASNAIDNDVAVVDDNINAQGHQANCIASALYGSTNNNARLNSINTIKVYGLENLSIKRCIEALLSNAFSASLTSN